MKAFAQAALAAEGQQQPQRGERAVQRQGAVDQQVRRPQEVGAKTTVEAVP